MEKGSTPLKLDVGSRLDQLSASVMRAFAIELKLKVSGHSTKLDLADLILTALGIENKDDILAKILAQGRSSNKNDAEEGEEERAPYYEEEVVDDGDVTTEAEKLAEKKGSAGTTQAAARPVELPERPDFVSKAPPGCTMRIIQSMQGSSPRWRGDLPVGASWQGQKSYSVAFVADTVNDVAVTGVENQRGIRAQATERGAQALVSTWLWAWYNASDEGAKVASASQAEAEATAEAVPSRNHKGKGTSSSSSSSSATCSVGGVVSGGVTCGRWGTSSSSSSITAATTTQKRSAADAEDTSQSGKRVKK